MFRRRDEQWTNSPTPGLRTQVPWWDGLVTTHRPADGVSLEPLSSRIRALGPSLSRTGTAIAAAITTDPAAVIRMTVSDLAALSGTSVGSVVRFCQDLGFKGYQDLKLHIAVESRSALQAEIAQPTGTPGAILTAVLRSSAQAIADAERSIDVEVFSGAAQALNAAGRVLFVGVGTSAPLAQDAAYRFKSLGLAAEAPADALNQHIAAALLRPSDVCLAVSHTGQTRETLSAVQAARDSGAGTIAVTSFHRSPLTALCEHVLVAGSAETAYRVEAMTSRFPHLAVLDALHSAVADHDPGRAAQAAQLVADAVSDHRL